LITIVRIMVREDKKNSLHLGKENEIDSVQMDCSNPDCSTGKGMIAFFLCLFGLYRMNYRDEEYNKYKIPMGKWNA
jgi:hypothetical protein